jgi:hypothetical protein
MAIKHYCDLCKEEVTGDIFRCELIVVQVKESFAFIKHQKDTKPQIVERRYQFCQKCLADKLPGFDN